jgi:hypothetical protein
MRHGFSTHVEFWGIEIYTLNCTSSATSIRLAIPQLVKPQLNFALHERPKTLK